MTAFEEVDWPLLCKTWLKEWIDKSEAKSGPQNNKAKGLARALDSLRTQPDLVISRPRDLLKVKHFGEKTCKKLEEAALKYCNDNGITYAPVQATQAKQVASGGAARAQRTSTAPYLPRFNSAAYHVLLHLRKMDRQKRNSDISRTELQRGMRTALMTVVPGISKGQRSLVSALNSLCNGKLVEEIDKRYSITDDGRRAADSLRRSEKALNGEPATSSPAGPVPTAASRESDAIPSSPSALSRPRFRVEGWAPHEYDIILIIDNRERAAGDDRRYFGHALAEHKVPKLEVSVLQLGDFAWVAEHKQTRRRAFLDYIVERKTFGDLASSINDGRLYEQKRRLVKSTLRHVVLLVEGDHNNIPEQRLKTVMSQTLALDGLFLRQSPTQGDTAVYLSMLDEQIRELYAGHTLCVVRARDGVDYTEAMQMAREDLSGSLVAAEYDWFNLAMHKASSFTIGDTFAMMLMTHKGVSSDKADAICKAFPTPRHLINAYRDCVSDTERADLVFEKLRLHTLARRRVTKQISQSIYEMWGKV